MKPTVARIVHYVSHGTPIREDGTQAYTSECRAAIITATSRDPQHPDRASLKVFSEEGDFNAIQLPRRGSCSDRENCGGTWHWPEMEQAPPIVDGA